MYTTLSRKGGLIAREPRVLLVTRDQSRYMLKVTDDSELRRLPVVQGGSNLGRIGDTWRSSDVPFFAIEVAGQVNLRNEKQWGPKVRKRVRSNADEPQARRIELPIKHAGSSSAARG